MEKHPLYNKSPQIKDKIDCLATTFAQCAFSIFLQIFLLFFSSKIKSNFSVLFICVVLSFMLLIRKFWLIKRIAFNVYFNRVHAMNFVVHDVWAGLWYSVDWMGLMLLHWLMMAVADDCVHLNVYEGNAVHLTDGIKMTIVSRNFDLAPNGVSDWIPNVHSLNGKLKNVRLEGSWFISYAFRPHSFLKDHTNALQSKWSWEMYGHIILCNDMTYPTKANTSKNASNGCRCSTNSYKANKRCMVSNRKWT